MESSRLSRFTRAPAIAPMQLTERDHEIIRHIYRHRFLRSTHIVALIDGNSQQLLRRLQLLFHHGYLERPRQQIEYYGEGGSRHIVYGLGDKGAAFLRREYGDSFDELHWGEKNHSIGRVYLQHALLVSDFIVALELCCRQSDHVRLLMENDLLSSANERFKWSVKLKDGVKLGVIPDRAFGLEFRDQTGELDRAYFFLEADRGTMPVIRQGLSQTSFFRKMLAYEATWSRSIHRKRFGFHRFRVLTVTTSAERVKSLLTACSQLKSGHGLFLFTDLETLKRHGNILSLPWQSGRHGKTNTLLD
jgi:hypothetical protein